MEKIKLMKEFKNIWNNPEKVLMGLFAGFGVSFVSLTFLTLFKVIIESKIYLGLILLGIFLFFFFSGLIIIKNDQTKLFKYGYIVSSIATVMYYMVNLIKWQA